MTPTTIIKKVANARLSKSRLVSFAYQKINSRNTNKAEMMTSAEKKALIAKLQQELEEEENDRLVDALENDVKMHKLARKHGSLDTNTSHQIIARSVSKKYGYATIPASVLKKLAHRLGVANVTQHHYSDPDRDYCGDGSYTWLQLGPLISDRIKQLEEELAELKSK